VSVGRPGFHDDRLWTGLPQSVLNLSAKAVGGLFEGDVAESYRWVIAFYARSHIGLPYAVIAAQLQVSETSVRRKIEQLLDTLCHELSKTVAFNSDERNASNSNVIDRFIASGWSQFMGKVIYVIDGSGTQIFDPEFQAKDTYCLWKHQYAVPMVCCG